MALPGARAAADAPAGARLVDDVRVGRAAFRVQYAPDDAEAARQISRALERAVPVAERWGTLAEPVTITVHPTHASLEAAARREGVPWMRAWARRASVEVQSPRTWSRGRATDAAMARLLAHELTHCATFQAAGAEADGLRRGIPRWFLEGMATVAAGQRGFRSASDGAYAPAHEAFVLLLERAGTDRVRRILDLMRAGHDFPSAFERSIGITPEAFQGELGRDRAASAGQARAPAHAA